MTSKDNKHEILLEVSKGVHDISLRIQKLEIILDNTLTENKIIKADNEKMKKDIVNMRWIGGIAIVVLFAILLGGDAALKFFKIFL